jgi:hypothetical protein
VSRAFRFALQCEPDDLLDLIVLELPMNIRPRNVAETLDAMTHEAPAPFGDRASMDLQLPSDRRVVFTLRTAQHDSGTQR